MSIKFRTLTSNMASAVADKPKTKQVAQGAGRLLALSLDRTDSSGLVTTIYDSSDANASVTGPTIYTQTGDVDLGQTVPVGIMGDADIVAGTVTAGVARGVIFTRGLYVVQSGDTTDTGVVLNLWYKPLIKKTVRLAAAATSSNINIFDGPGLFHGYRIKMDGVTVGLGTADILFTDESDNSQSGPTLMTKTNYATSPSVRQVATTTHEDEAGAAVTTAATGTYANDGIFFKTGLSANVAQAANPHDIQLEVLIEA